MPAGTPVVGTAVTIEVAPNTPALSNPPTAGTYVDCNDLTTLSKNSTRNKQTQSVFMRATAYATYGQREVTYSVNGLLSVGDSGQDILRAAEASNDVVFVKITWDGTNGFSVPCRVGSHTGNSTPENRVEITYELSAEADATMEGTGPIW
jgi:hypothetical protein